MATSTIAAPSSLRSLKGRRKAPKTHQGQKTPAPQAKMLPRSKPPAPLAPADELQVIVGVLATLVTGWRARMQSEAARTALDVIEAIVIKLLIFTEAPPGSMRFTAQQAGPVVGLRTEAASAAPEAPAAKQLPSSAPALGRVHALLAATTLEACDALASAQEAAQWCECTGSQLDGYARSDLPDALSELRLQLDGLRHALVSLSRRLTGETRLASLASHAIALDNLVRQLDAHPTRQHDAETIREQAARAFAGTDD